MQQLINVIKNNKINFLTILTVIFFSYFKLGTTILNMDGHHWFNRSTLFYTQLQNLNFAGTYTDPKPGVTVMYIAGFGIIFLKLILIIIFGSPTAIYWYQQAQSFNYPFFLYFNAAAEFFLVTTHLIFLAIFYKNLKTLFNQQVAYISTLFLALHPFYLANTRFLHTDSTLTIFMTLSAIYIFNFVQNKNFKYLIISAVFIGLALLTKTQAIFSILYIALILLINFFKQPKLLIQYFLTVIATVSIVFFILFPAMWINSIQVFSNIFTEAFFVAQIGNTSKQPLSFYIYSLPRIYGYAYFLFFISGIIFYIKNFKTQNKIYFYLFLYLAFYFLQALIIKQKVDRYLIPMFPFMAIFTGVFISTILNKITISINNIKLICLGVLTIVIMYYTPYYIVFGNTKHEFNYYGALYAKAAHFINFYHSNAVVVAHTKTHTLKPFINGGHVYNYEQKDRPKGNKVDYFITNDYWINKYGIPEDLKVCQKVEQITFKNWHFWDIYYCNY